VAERDLENGVHVVKAKHPAVITVAQEINQPRLPTLRSILAASKKEIKQVSPQQLGLDPGDLKPVVITKTVVPPKTDRKRVVIDGSKPEEAVRTLVNHLRQEGVV